MAARPQPDANWSSGDPPEPEGDRIPTGSDVIHVSDATGRFPATAHAWLRQHATKIGIHMNLRGEVRVRIVDDAEMAAAHLEYCEIEGTTDVLTFDLVDGMAAQGHPLDTDIMVCLDEAARQAPTRGHQPEHEMLLYILHGVLHCLGFDDHEEEDFVRMHAREDEVLSAIGVGAIFAKPTSLPPTGGHS